MNKNTIIGIVLIFALMIGYTIMMSPSEEQLAERKRVQDSIIAAQQQQQRDTTQFQLPVAPVDSQVRTEIRTNEIVDTALLQSKNYELYGDFAPAASGKDEQYVIESDLLKITILNKGGRIGKIELKEYSTYDSKPLVLFDENSSDLNVAFFAGLNLINTRDLYFAPVFPENLTGDSNRFIITGSDSLRFAMRLYAGAVNSEGTSDKYIEFLYTVESRNYLVDYKVNFVNMEGIIASNTKDIAIDWTARLRSQEKNHVNERNSSTVFLQHADKEVDNLKETKDDQVSVSTPVKWISYSQQFFASSFIADDVFRDVSIKKTLEPETETTYLQNMMSTITVPYNSRSAQIYDFGFYYGPKKYNILRKYKLDLEKQIPLGWGFFLMQWINRYAVIPVFNFLEGFNLNYGIIILILTILLKIVLFPIAYKTYISSAKMRLLKPEIEEINAKYPKSDEAMKKQQATMALYKKAGVNPMAGCIPMLLQLPILIAMFRFFPASIELRQESFLWANDLSSYDSVLDLPFTIPFYGDHVSLFTLLMTISTIIYTKLNNDMMSTGNQMPGMKTMMYLMPVMFLGFFNSFASGLSYYYLLANLITFAQMFIIRRFVNEQKLHAQIQENKKKPVKKSNFQKRLEDMAKQQQKRR